MPHQSATELLRLYSDIVSEAQSRADQARQEVQAAQIVYDNAKKATAQARKNEQAAFQALTAAQQNVGDAAREDAEAQRKSDEQAKQLAQQATQQTPTVPADQTPITTPVSGIAPGTAS